MTTGYAGVSGYGGETPPPVTCETLFDNIVGNVTITDGNTGALFGSYTGFDLANTPNNFIAEADEKGIFFSFDISSLTSGDGIAFGFGNSSQTVFAFANFVYSGTSFTLTISTSTTSGGPVTLAAPLSSDEYCVTISSTGNTIRVYRNQSLEISLPTLSNFSQLDHAFTFLTAQSGSSEQVFLIQNPTPISGVTQYCTNE